MAIWNKKLWFGTVGTISSHPEFSGWLFTFNHFVVAGSFSVHPNYNTVYKNTPYPHWWIPPQIKPSFPTIRQSDNPTIADFQNYLLLFYKICIRLRYFEIDIQYFTTFKTELWHWINSKLLQYWFTKLIVKVLIYSNRYWKSELIICRIVGLSDCRK